MLDLVVEQPVGEPVLVILSDSIAADQGYALIRRLRRRPQKPAVLLLIQRDAALGAQWQALGRGVAIVAVRSLGTGRVLRALQALRQGQGYGDPALETASASDRPSLTPREWQVLAGVVAGQSNAAIAAALGMAPSTVRDHVSALLQRLKLANRTALASRALHEGWVRR